MAVLNINAKELHLKILYCGAEGVGKKSSLQSIHSLCESQKSKWIHFPFEKPLYGLVIHVGLVLKLQTYFHIYHLNNQSKKENEILSRGTDGWLFIASLKPQDKIKNQGAFLEMEELILKQGKNLFKIPLVLQYHKADLKKRTSLNQMRLDLNKYNSKDFLSSHLKTQSVLLPLKHLLKTSLLSGVFSV